MEHEGSQVRFGFAVIETTDDESILAREPELLEEILEVRAAEAHLLP